MTDYLLFEQSASDHLVLETGTDDLIFETTPKEISLLLGPVDLDAVAGDVDAPRRTFVLSLGAFQSDLRDTIEAYKEQAGLDAIVAGKTFRTPSFVELFTLGEIAELEANTSDSDVQTEIYTRLTSYDYDSNQDQILPIGSERLVLLMVGKLIAADGAYSQITAQNFLEATEVSP